MNRRSIVIATTYIVAVYAATIILQIYQPATGGYFNLGETVIYIAAILHGPLIAGIAGGVGASLADLSTGYAIFAPATFVIKFTEGYVAGYLIQRYSVRIRRYKGVAAGLVGGLYTGLLIYFSVVYWSGTVFIGPEQIVSLQFPSISINVPVIVWVAAAVVLGGLLTWVLARRYMTEWEPVALLLAGLIMVIGYFLYEYFVSNPATGRPSFEAVFEVPVNVGQALVGAVLAVPIAGWLRRAGYGSAGETVGGRG